jgi:cobalt-zinc-cadmium efflux system outer membrane protein
VYPFGKRAALGAALVIASAAGPASGQAAPETVSLSRLRAMALRAHPAAAQAEALNRLGKAGISAARTWDDPEVALVFDEARPPDTDVPRESENAWSVTQRLPFPLSYGHGITAAELSSEARAAEARAVQLDLFFQVDRVYYDLAAAEERVELLSQSAADAEEVLAIATRRVEIGEARESERLRAEIELLRQRRVLGGARREVTVLRETLRRIAGPDLPADFRIEPRWPAAREVGSRDDERARLRDNPSLAAARALSEAAEEARIAAKWGIVPDLRAGVFGENEIDRDAIGFSFGLSVPLWNANRPAIARAGAEASLAAAEYRRLEIELETSLDAALAAFALASEQSETYRTRLLPAARESLRIAQLAYEEGETSFLELLDSQRTYREAVTEFLDVNRQAAASYSEIRRLRGDSTDEAAD